MNTAAEQAQRAFEVGLESKNLLLNLVKNLDSDLVELARDEYAQSGGSTEKAQRATTRLMAIVALIAPELIEAPEE